MKKNVNALDKYNLRRVILEEYKQFEEGSCVAQGKVIPGVYDEVILCGMGGSALPGEVVDQFLRDASARFHFSYIPLSIHRSYGLPLSKGKNPLYITCSHSGNTEETLSALEEAIEEKKPVIGVSSGGKMEKVCQEKNIPFAKLPIPFEAFQPRMATGHFFGALLTLLVQSNVISKEVYEKVQEEALSLKKIIEDQETLGKAIAKTLVGKTPVIYASESMRSLALIWKIKINENAKTPAFWNYFPELNHNEMVGFTNPQADFTFLLLRDEQDDSRIRRRYEVFETLIQKQGMTVQILDIQGDSVYSKVFSTLALGDWISYYLALEYGIDPTPVDMVENFKKML